MPEPRERGDSVSVDSSIMDPFKITATSEQKQDTRSAMNSLMEDMSYDSTIRFESPGNTRTKRGSESRQLTHTTSIEAEVLKVCLVKYYVVLKP